jgi:hypothetical protein
MKLPHDDPLAAELGRSIRTGDLAALQALVASHPGIAAAAIEDRTGGARTPLHIVTDWPGYFPNGPAIVAALLSAGADPNVIIGAGHTETPLHWAASSADVDVAEALIAGGANLEALGTSIAGGTPLDNAVGYGCWHVARLLVDRGAQVDKLWHAAALGLMSRVVEFCTQPDGRRPTS